MTELEAAEARRRERAATENLKIPQAEDLQAAFDRLYKTIGTFRYDPQRDDADRATKVAALRSTWKAPERHLNTVITDQCKQWCEKLVKLTTKLNTGFLVALVGARGPGKTQLAVELMKAQTVQLRSARFCVAMEFFVDLKCSFDREIRQPNQNQVLVDYARPQLLVIDECQERGETPWEDRLLTYLINRRYNDRRDTLLIANQTEQEFAKSMGASITSRLVETGGIIVCDWPSFRTPNKP